MEKKRKLPMGIEDFERIQRDGFYYVDKTRMIKDLLENMALVNLFTRPRRFGKTLNMSMLKHFFEIGGDNALFDGLEISGEKELCDKYMGHFPVISISLKNAASDSFSSAKEMLCSIIGQEALRFPFLSESDCLSETERRQYNAMIHVDDDGVFTMKDSLLKNSLLLLSCFLQRHYGQKTILLIDEYDVPLENAFFSGFYDQMVPYIRSLFESVLKTNDCLEFAVVTGCLRISKESIFTGLNNLNMNSILTRNFGEYFGFHESEVEEMLTFYGIRERFAEVREWYDGYLFGETEIYNPWSLISYEIGRAHV